MTDREYYNKLAEFHERNIKRAFIPKEEFSQKEYFEFQQEYRDFTIDYVRQKQAEKQLEKALDDLLKGFDGNINIEL